MFSWLAGLFRNPLSGLTDLANQVRNAITNAVNSFIAEFVAWANAFRYLLGKGVWTFEEGYHFVRSFTGMMLRLALVWLPNQLYKVTVDAAHYAEYLAGVVQNIATALYNQAIAYAAQAVNALTSWVWGQLTAIVTALNHWIAVLADVAPRVYALLTDPRALADWIAGNIVQAIFRWALANAETLARLALAAIIPAMVTGASIIEQIITDIWL